MLNLAYITWLPLLLPLASAECYSGGTEVDTATGNNGINAICPTLVGYYKSKEFRTGCATGGAGSWYFEVRNIASGTRYLTLDACRSGLGKEVNGCQYGGRTKYTNWFYRSDSTNGICQDNSAINAKGKRNSVHIVVPGVNQTAEWDVEVADPDTGVGQIKG